MIPLSQTVVQPQSWQQELAQAVTDPVELCQMLGIEPEDVLADPRTRVNFSLKVTRNFVARMRPGDLHDPLLRQVLPVTAETDAVDGYLSDPVGDLDATLTPGLIHKYAGRVLLVTTPACAVHCRYCFRRHFPYHEGSAHGRQLESALETIRQQTDLHEVILSGGDPLTLADGQLAQLVRQVEQIEHIRTLRLHTRLPIVLPSRVTDELLKTLANSRLQVVMVVHANHAQELSPEVGDALRALVQADITLLNQSVLLAGVNDDARALCALSMALFDCRVLPYYLHLLDPVDGAAHFQVAEADARQLHEQMRSQLPGYLLPRLVREIRGAAAKTPVG